MLPDNQKNKALGTFLVRGESDAYLRITRTSTPRSSQIYSRISNTTRSYIAVDFAELESLLREAINLVLYLDNKHFPIVQPVIFFVASYDRGTRPASACWSIRWGIGQQNFFTSFHPKRKVSERMTNFAVK